MNSNNVVRALEAALAVSPSDTALRSELIRQLISADSSAEAVQHAEHLMATDAANASYARLAAVAHRANGDHASANALDMAADALSGAAATADAPPAPVSSDDPANAGDERGSERESAIPDTADELLDAWSESPALEEIDFGEITRPSVTLADVGGLADVKRQLDRSFLSPIRNPELAASFGKTGEGGLLLWGPPGCGKTYLARAVAGEMNASFYSVAITDVLEMWQGKSAQNLSAIFDAARRNTPCVLFFDEIDALGHKRSNLAYAQGLRNVVNQLLAELDGVNANNEGLFVLGATNHPWDIDEALLRPGRFDRKLLVLPPDEEARLSILQVHMRGLPVDGVDLTALVAETAGFSGADLRLIIETATENCLAASMDLDSLVPITTAHLRHALTTVKSTIGPWLENARNHVLYANRSGDYDELERYLAERDAAKRRRP